jgi:hypothetical protein
VVWKGNFKDSRENEALCAGCDLLVSRGGDSEEVVGSPGAVFDTTLCLQAVGISFDGNEKGFLDIMAQVVEGQRLEVPVSTPKIKGNRELHNLECDINYDAKSLGSTQGRSKRAML